MTPHRDSLHDFDSARRKVFVQRILTFITRQSIDLLPFEQVHEQLRLRDRHYQGLSEVPLNQIVGSVGRYQDFTRTFLPRRDELRERWAAVEDRVKEGGLPPVELYKVGEVYFVRDGNHRVSVARAQRVPDIEAFVWEYPSLVPLIEHIAVHRYYLGQQNDREFSAEEAVTSWYDNAYLPIIRAIRKHGILKQFPGRTEADLYIWISRWQHELSERYAKLVSAEEAVDDFAERDKGLDE